MTPAAENGDMISNGPEKSPTTDRWSLSDKHLAFTA
jgi:hypothetical protein